MIENKTKKRVLCKDKKILRSVFSKAIGLMFSKRQAAGYVFVFKKPTKADLHMFFVFYPIDVIFLDECKKVIEIKENFMPFTFYLPKNKAAYVLELPEKTVQKNNTELGDLIIF